MIVWCRYYRNNGAPNVIKICVKLNVLGCRFV
jgi:hypothetical protein